MEIEIVSDLGRKYLAVATLINRDKSKGDWIFHLMEIHKNDERTPVGRVVISRPMSILDPGIRKDMTLEAIEEQISKHEKQVK